MHAECVPKVLARLEGCTIDGDVLPTRWEVCCTTQAELWNGESSNNLNLGYARNRSNGCYPHDHVRNRSYYLLISQRRIQSHRMRLPALQLRERIQHELGPFCGRAYPFRMSMLEDRRTEVPLHVPRSTALQNHGVELVSLPPGLAPVLW